MGRTIEACSKNDISWGRPTALAHGPDNRYPVARPGSFIGPGAAREQLLSAVSWLAARGLAALRADRSDCPGISARA